MEGKWEKALKVVGEYAGRACIFFTGDKESTLLLELRKGWDIPVLFVDTGLYPAELYQYLEEAQKFWDFQAVVLRNDRVIEESEASNKEECYRLLTEKIVFPYLSKEGREVLIEPLKGTGNEKREGGILRVFPLEDFSELDVWRSIKEMGLPYCPLYNRGIRDVGCEPCSKRPREEEVDQEEVRRRLKALGYL